MHEVDISPLPVQVVNLDLPIVLGTTGAEAVLVPSNAMAYVPVVTAVRHALVNAVGATGSGIVYRPVSVTGSVGAGATIVVPYILSTGAVRTPTVSADQTVNAVLATSTGGAAIPTPIGAGATLVVAVKATSSANASAPVVSGGIDASVTAVIATAATTALVPAIPLLSVTVNAVVAKTNAVLAERAITPVVSGEIVLFGGGPGIANMIAIPPTTILSASPTFVAAVGGATPTGATTVDFGVPAGVTGGPTQIVMVAFYLGNDSTVITPPAGFNEDLNSPVIAPGYNLRVFWKRPTAPDTGVYTFNFNVLTGISGGSALYAGCVSSGIPIEGSVGAVDADASFTTTPAVSTTAISPSRMAVWIVADGSNSGVVFTGGYTERWDRGFAALADSPVSAAGPVPISGTLVANTGLADQAAAWLGLLRAT